MGQTSFNQDATTWASAIFAEAIGTFMLMYAILGIVDSRSPGDFAGIVIGGVVVAIIMVIGPITGASLNPARAFGPELVSAIGGGATHWNQLIPVYVLPGLVGSALAAFAYDFMTTPRVVEMPIRCVGCRCPMGCKLTNCPRSSSCAKSTRTSIAKSSKMCSNGSTKPSTPSSVGS